jgi:hypothetical protein
MKFETNLLSILAEGHIQFSQGQRPWNSINTPFFVRSKNVVICELLYRTKQVNDHRFDIKIVVILKSINDNLTRFLGGSDIFHFRPKAGILICLHSTADGFFGQII